MKDIRSAKCLSLHRGTLFFACFAPSRAIRNDNVAPIARCPYIQSIVPGTIPMAIPTPTPIKMGNVSGHVPH